jgi:uncharacterized ion transporter superfamily protein YfcC
MLNQSAAPFFLCHIPKKFKKNSNISRYFEKKEEKDHQTNQKKKKNVGEKLKKKIMEISRKTKQKS